MTAELAIDCLKADFPKIQSLIIGMELSQTLLIPP